MRPEPDPNDLTPGMHIWGWMAPVELRWLMGTASKMNSVVEIGSLHGRSAFALAKACRGMVYCIDPWDDEHDLSYGSFIRGVGSRLDNVTAIRGRSPGVLKTSGYLAGRTFDMVFIDGDHKYDSVRADIDAWLPHTRKMICGHDFHDGPDAGFPDVARAVKDVFGERYSVAPDTSIWTVEL